MPKRSFLLPTLALVLAAAAPASAGGPETRRSEAGLEYSIRIPRKYDKARGARLVLALHGVSEKHENFMRTMDSMPFLEDAIVVVPQAPGPGARWEAGDLVTVSALLRELQDEHRPPRTIAYGFSAGAYFTYSLALAYPDLIQAAIPHSGGLAAGLPDADKAKNLVFYVIHGDADGVVPVDGSREARKALEGAGLRVQYEELKGVGHVLDHPATGRGFAWIEKTLGPSVPELTDAETADRLKALDKALKAKDWDAAARGFAALRGASRGAHAKIAALAKAQFSSPQEALALAAIAACGTLGEDGVPALRSISPEKEALAVAAAGALSRTGSPAAAEPLLKLLEARGEAVAVAAASELRHLGGDPALGALVAGLQRAETSKTGDGRKDAIVAALSRLTGQSFATSKEWKAWLKGRGR